MAEKKYASASDILADAQDLVVLRRSGDNHVYAVKPSLEAQRQLYLESIADPSERDIPAFQGHWKLGKTGIEGSSTFLTLRLDKRALRPRGLWVPGLLEAKALESKGKLENGVYRDYSTVVHSVGNPHKETAEEIAKQAKSLGLGLPLIAPFKSLDYSCDRKSKYGIAISLVKSPTGLISGQDAQAQIDALDFKSDSGFRWLGRDRDGGWNADWNYLDYSDEDGRVEWFCGEAAREKIIEANATLTERKYAQKIRALETQMTKLEEAQIKERADFEKSLNQ